MARRNALFEVKQIEQLVRISSTHYLANALFVPACSARVQNLEGVALRVTGTVPLPLGDPSTQRSMNRVVAQQELERQTFRVRGSRGDDRYSASSPLAASPVPRNGKIDPGDNDPPTPPPKITQGGNDPLNPPSSPSTASLSGVARCWHSNAYFSLFSSLFFFDPPNRFVQIPRDFHSFDPVGFAIFAMRSQQDRRACRPDDSGQTCNKRLLGLIIRQRAKDAPCSRVRSIRITR